MLKQLQKRNDGFTIIEVLIVLAIAGLIMVVVFLAVPNLQRNSRNNETKNNANNVASAYSEVSANLGGKVLSTADELTAVKKASGLSDSTNISQANVTLTKSITAVDFKSTDQAVIVTGAKCPDTPAPGAKVTPIKGNTRQVAVLYAVETADGLQGQCVTS